MKLTCKSCSHDFSIDEHNIDTDRVDCPKCTWPNLIVQSKINHGYFGHFAKRSSLNAKYKRNSSWPKH